MSHARRALSASSKKLAARRRSYRPRRLYEAERLELRSLMAGDVAPVAPYHNSWYAQDVNNDYIVTPLDALLIINELNALGPRALTAPQASGGQGESGEYNLIDVNGDGMLTPLDALEVINHINAQGEAPYVATVRAKLFDKDGNEILPTGMTPDNKPIYTIAKGDVYSVSYGVRDNRPQTIPGDTTGSMNTTPLGIYATFGDLVFDTAYNKAGFQEQQNLVLSGLTPPSPNSTTTNSTATLTLTIPNFNGGGNRTTAPIQLFGTNNLKDENADNIANALEAALGVGPGSVEVTFPNSSANGTYSITFGGGLTGIDIGTLQTSIVSTGLGNTPAITVNDVFSPPAIVDEAYLSSRANILKFLKYNMYTPLGGNDSNALLDLTGSQVAIVRVGGQANGDITVSPDGVSDTNTDYQPDDGDEGFIEIVRPYFVATTATPAGGTAVSWLRSGSADGTPDESSGSYATLVIGNTSGTRPTVPADRVEYAADFVLVIKGDVTAVADPVTTTEGSAMVSIDATANDTNNVAGVTTKIITGFGANGNSTTDIVSAEGLLHLNTATNRIEFTPSANFYGTYTFQYGVTDSIGGNVKDVGTVTITVTEVNDPPTAVADNFNGIPALVTAEDTPLAIPVSLLLANDSATPDPTTAIPGITINGVDTLSIAPSVDGSGNVLATGGWVLPQHGTLKFAAGTLTYQPNQDYFGTDTFTYALSDGRGGTATAVVTLNVTPINDAPVANPDTGNVPDGVQTVFAVLDNDTDVESNTLTLQSFTIVGGTRPEVTVAQVGNTIVVTSQVGYFGASAPDMIINYTVSDGSLPSTSTLTLTFIPSRFPLAVDDTVTGKVTEDAATATDITADLLGNDRGQGAANAGLKITGISLTDLPAGDAGWTTTGDITAADGTVVSIDANGNVSIKGGNNVFGNFTFFYRLDDTINVAPPDYEGPDVAQAVVVITPENDAPTLGAITDPAASLETNGTIVRTVTNFATASPGPLETGLYNGVQYDTVSYVVELVNAADAAKFTASGQPAIDANGTLTYTPADSANGTVQVRVQARDSFGVLSATTETFNIVITPVNNPPVFTTGANQTVAEDAGGTGVHSVANWITGIGPGAANETGEVLNFEILTNDNPGLFATLPSITISGTSATLAYATTADANGVATITYRLNGAGGALIGDPNSSDIRTLVITVTPVNDQPSFTKGADQNVDEDAGGNGVHSIPNWATGISAGPANESAEVLSFALTNTNNSLFSVQPTLTITGNTATLNYTTAANANGNATVTVRLNGAGGAGIGAANFVEQTFVINVAAVNDAPTFTPGANQTVLEDAAGTGAHSVPNWITGISPGATNESTETLQFEILTNSNPGLFSTAPAIAISGTNGTLSYTTAANQNGTATITYRLNGLGDGGVGAPNSSAVQTLVINVTAVNDKPAFTLANSTANPLVVNEDGAVQAGGLGNANSPSYAIDNFVTAFNPGPASATDEASQTLNFTGRVNVSNPGLFTAGGQPQINSAGQLTFTLRDNVNGTTTISVRAQDNGGTANGGVDLSDEVTFTLNVAPVNDPPTANDDSGPALRIFKFVETSEPINLVQNDTSAPDGPENLTIQASSLTNFTTTPHAESPAGAAANLSFTLSADGKSVILHNPDGFFGTISLTYTVQDPGGLTDTAVATFEVVNFIPGTISGVVWGDSNGDGRITPANDPYHAERKIGGIEVYLTGNSIFNTGNPAQEDLDPNTAGVQRVLRVRTDANGHYTFADISPGTYTISLDNPETTAVEAPEHYVDGLDIIREVGATPAQDKITNLPIGGVYQVVDPTDATHKTAVTHTAANTFKVQFNELGTNVNLDFGVSLAPGAINIRDNVSNSTFDGALFAVNRFKDGDEQQMWFSAYENWTGTRCLVSYDPTTLDVNLSWDDGTNTHFVKLNLARNPNLVRVHMSAANGDTVIRIVGSLSTILASVAPQYRTTQANAQLPTSEDAYATAVDAYFESHW